MLRAPSMIALNCAILAGETPVADVAFTVSVGAATTVGAGALGIVLATIFFGVFANASGARLLAACRLAAAEKAAANACDLPRASRAAFSDWAGSGALAIASTTERRLASALCSFAALVDGTSAGSLCARASALRSNALANSTLADVAVRFISSARAVASSACSGLSRSACIPSACWSSFSLAAIRLVTALAGAPAFRASSASVRAAGASPLTSASATGVGSVPLGIEMGSEPDSVSPELPLPNMMEPAATATSSAAAPPATTATRGLLDATFGSSLAPSRAAPTACFGVEAAGSDVAIAGCASPSSVFAGSAAMTGATSVLFEALVSCPAFLNCASLGLVGTRVSSDSLRSTLDAGGATGTISSAATSWAKKRVGSSSPLTGDSASFFPNMASHSLIDCGRSVGLIVMDASIAWRKRLLKPGQLPSASDVPRPPCSRSSTSGGFSPVTHSYSTTPSA